MKKKLKYLIVTALIVTFLVCCATTAHAEEAYNPVTDEIAEDNLFAQIYEEISAYTSEILCVLTFGGSLILAIAYKKGLLPIVKGSLLSIGNAVSNIKESAGESIEKTSQLEKSFEIAKEKLDVLTNRVCTLDQLLREKLDMEDEEKKAKIELKLVLNSQIDMLYDIFMASALPQYQKDAVGEKIAKMKGALCENYDTDKPKQASVI